MSNYMDLMNKNDVPKTNPTTPSGVSFSLHALAVIEIHDSDEAKKRNLTIREICQGDTYMESVSDSIAYLLFKAFGRNCIPVFEKYLEPIYAGEVLKEKVHEVVTRIRGNLDL